LVVGLSQPTLAVAAPAGTGPAQGLTVNGGARNADATPEHNASWSLPASYTETQLATNGQGGFPNYRIPALTVAPNGDLLASYDGRPTGGDAPGPNSILQRRSTDGGKTWGEQTVVAAGKAGSAPEGFSDPSYVVDRESGTLFNFHVHSYDQGFLGSHAGTDPEDRQVLHAAVSTSTDNGATWTSRDITADITPDPTWRSRFAASGQGIQLHYGSHAGRLVQQYTIRNGDGVFQAVSVYSDDHGATWHSGKPVGTGMDENKSVELSDGTVMLNSRDSAGSHTRKVAYSTDGGATYGAVRTDPQLPDPTNNASIIRAFPTAAEGSAEARILLFSNAASTSSRSNGTVRVSFDDGRTWSGSKVFQPGGMAYSTLTTQPDGSIGLLYEPDGGNGGIRYARFTLAWLGVLPTTVSAQDVAANPGQKVKARVDVTNVSGSALRSVKLEADAPAGFKAKTSAMGEIPAGGTSSAKVTVQVPADAVTGHHTVHLTVSSGTATATAQLDVHVPPALGELVTVVAEAHGVTDAHVGDRVPVTYRVTNLAARTLAVVPTGDLTGFSRPTAPNCGYGSLAAGASYTCSTAFHTLTQADLDRGAFTPHTTWEIRDGSYTAPVLTTLHRDGPDVPVKAAKGLLPRDAWSVDGASSQETTSAADPASAAADGDAGTFWHSAWSQTAGDQWIQLDAGSVRKLAGLGYLPRQDGGNNGVVRGYEVEVSKDGQEWSSVATGELQLVRSWEQIRFPSVKARYVRLVVRTSYSDAGKNFGSAAELDLYRK